MNPTQRRKSTLGRRNRNRENPLIAPAAWLPLVSPGLGRLGAGAKGPNNFRKQLFSTFSSGKSQFGSSSRATHSSPNDSQCSYQSDSSLNLTTGVKVIKMPSSDYKSTTNPNLLKSNQDYSTAFPHVPVVTPSSIRKPAKWDAIKLEPPPSPPPSRYDRLIQLELACIKQPVDPDDLLPLENLTLDESSDSSKSYSKPITSTVAKEVDCFKFSPLLSPTCVNSTLMLSSEKEVGIYNSMLNTNKSVDSLNKSCASLENKTKFTQSNGSISPISKGLDLKLNYKEKQVFNKENKQVKPSKSENDLNTFDKGLKHSLVTDGKFDSSKDPNGKVAMPVNSVSRSLQFDQHEFRKPLALSNSKRSSSAVDYFETRTGFSESLNATLSNKPNHSLSISNAIKATNNRSAFSTLDPNETLSSKEDADILPNANKHDETDRKLSIINEKDLSNEDLNSTSSFLLAEQTIIDQDQYRTDSQTATKSSRTVVNENYPIPKCNETSGSDDEIAQAMGKVDTILNKMVCVKSRMLNEISELENELKCVKASLQQFKDKRSKPKYNVTENKENIPSTETKQIKSKWFNVMKSENPNLLKTPNPARQSVSRMSLANQSIMTPHSLSVVISDQLNDLFN